MTKALSHPLFNHLVYISIIPSHPVSDTVSLNIDLGFQAWHWIRPPLPGSVFLVCLSLSRPPSPSPFVPWHGKQGHCPPLRFLTLPLLCSIFSALAVGPRVHSWSEDRFRPHPGTCCWVRVRCPASSGLGTMCVRVYLGEEGAGEDAWTQTHITDAACRSIVSQSGSCGTEWAAWPPSFSPVDLVQRGSRSQRRRAGNSPLITGSVTEWDVAMQSRRWLRPPWRAERECVCSIVLSLFFSWPFAPRSTVLYFPVTCNHSTIFNKLVSSDCLTSQMKDNYRNLKRVIACR